MKIMNYSVTIKPHPSKEPALVINEHLAERLNLTRKKRCVASFGNHKNFVNIFIKKDVPENEISLSVDVIENLLIPTYPSFEIRIMGNEIMFGPCIGILSDQRDSSITKTTLKEASMNALDYASIKGAMILFALDKVNKVDQLIEGYCYNPKNDSWERGRFPYPLSIYRKITISDEWQNHFLSVIGDTVFNNYFFDKWDMYRWFSKELNLLPHIPETTLFEEKRNITEMLEKYNVLYIKPSQGMKGTGIVKVIKENQKITFMHRADDKNIEVTTEGENDFKAIVGKLFEPGNYIIQQGLELISFKGGIVDFRCAMQKNEAFEWVCNGIFARTGAKESIVSNISDGGTALPSLELMKEIFNLSEIEAFNMKNSIISVCSKACMALDEYGLNLGTLGLDIGIDKNRNIWLIEINNRRPHPRIALRANDIQSYYAIMSGPMHYAKALAGFRYKEVDDHVL